MPQIIDTPSALLAAPRDIPVLYPPRCWGEPPTGALLLFNPHQDDQTRDAMPATDNPIATTPGVNAPTSL